MSGNGTKTNFILLHFPMFKQKRKKKQNKNRNKWIRQKKTDKAANEKLKRNKQNIKENQTQRIQHNINQPKSKQKQKEQQIVRIKILLLTFTGGLIIEVQGLYYQRVGPLEEKNTHAVSNETKTKKHQRSFYINRALVRDLDS